MGLSDYKLDAFFHVLLRCYSESVRAREGAGIALRIRGSGASDGVEDTEDDDEYEDGDDDDDDD